jgi:hypothetical protein
MLVCYVLRYGLVVTYLPILGIFYRRRPSVPPSVLPGLLVLRGYVLALIQIRTCL